MAIEPAVLPSDAPLHVATSKPAASFTSRLEAVDLLRGAVMVLMAIDHTRDFFGNVISEPMDLSQLSPAMFLTRWVTHFCAPAFAFLAGTGAYLAGVRGRSRGELAAFLASRGVWLVFLELTVVKFSILFDPAPTMWFLLVFWSIGASMVVLSGLVFLPSRVVGALGVLLIATYSLIDRLPLGAFHELGVLLFQRGVISLPGGVNVIVGYPLIPWFGVVAAGYGFGEVLRWEPARRRRFMMIVGLGLTAAFVLLRAWGIYGEPRPWTTQRTPLLTALEFLNCTKNPPSPLFLLMTLGPAIAAMSVFDRLGARGAAGRTLVTIGRVPLFFFILHLYVIHGLGLVAQGILATGPLHGTVGWPLGLAGVYAVWAVMVFILYWPCRWFAGVKARHPGGWLSYL